MKKILLDISNGLFLAILCFAISLSILELLVIINIDKEYLLSGQGRESNPIPITEPNTGYNPGFIPEE